MIYKDFVLHLLNNSITIANKHFGKVEGQTKVEDSNQVLTQADLEIGELLVDAIKTTFPAHNVIDEESGVINNNSEYTWVVDPIDGTSNFAAGLPMYGIMIGLLKGNVPIAGGVALPYFRDVYYAEKGMGATCNDDPIHATEETDLLKTLVVYALDGHREDPERTYDECKLLAQIILNIRNYRASNSCFDIMMVARGRYGGWCNQTSKIWDNVAPQILLEEAGVTVTDFFGKEIDYSNPLAKSAENFTICAAPPALHKKLQEIISAS